MVIRTAAQSAQLGSIQMCSTSPRTVFEPHSRPVTRDSHGNVKIVSHLPSSKAQRYANPGIDVHPNIYIVINAVAVNV